MNAPSKPPRNRAAGPRASEGRSRSAVASNRHYLPLQDYSEAVAEGWKRADIYRAIIHGGNGHNGGRFEDRLRNVEIQLAKMETKLDTELGHLATKNDLTAVKVWGLSGVFGGMAIAAGVAMAIARLL